MFRFPCNPSFIKKLATVLVINLVLLGTSWSQSNTSWQSNCNSQCKDKDANDPDARLECIKDCLAQSGVTPAD